ncbi:sodium-dependent multivitamin transporter-like [Ptychodera flava]|uniref:sodium-dependent multivitamin transporter-like n=1 Tax=Ptychodera flava TaxID=63121 RepID=UPI003969C592
MSDGLATPLGVVDWIVFIAVLAVSAITGVYFCLAKGGQKTTPKYFLANRKLGCVVLATSYFVTFTSSMSILGLPAEIYVNGIAFVFALIGVVLSGLLVVFTFVPVIRGLDIISVYEYMALRFHPAVQITCAGCFAFLVLLYMGSTMIGPGIALEATDNAAYWITVVATGSVCTFYTTLGGLSAVVWSDVFQFMVMFASIVAVLVIGTIDSGGITEVLRRNYQKGHLQIDTRFDLTARSSMWSMLLSGIMTALINVINQGAVQRIMAAKSVRRAQGTLLLTVPFKLAVYSMMILTGLALFSFYNNKLTPLFPPINGTFSPTENFTVNLELLYEELDTVNYEPHFKRPDQILVYFVSGTLGYIPGIQGLFISSLFAGSLSSISSGLNAMVAVALRDIVKPWRRWRSRRSNCPLQESDARDIVISKILTLVFGLISTALALVLPHLGTLINISMITFGAIGGPIAGAFTLGLSYPRANSWGTLVGICIGILLGMWIGVGTMLARMGTATMLPVYKITPPLYGMASFVVTISVGILISEIVRCIKPSEKRKNVDPKLLIPCFRPKEVKPDNIDIPGEFIPSNDNSNTPDKSWRHWEPATTEKRFGRMQSKETYL